MEVGTIRQINIDNEMQASYLDYAMSVIVSRALPDVRDGLKPVHRRILYAMYDLGLTSDKPYKKSARIVGEVLGKYHPHGDAAVYEAMVRMAQDFSLRYPLVDGQGNFGSIDGDNAAAMRYTEARLAPIANEMLADIDKDTVDWTDNFDGSLREPTVLPAALPNLIVNGAAGIAVGMATNIPPHNLGEVCDALCYLIDNYNRAEDVTTEDLMKFIQGPDFPTGGIVFRYANEGTGEAAERVDVIEKAYGSGKGSLVVQARAQIEEMSRGRSRIVVTELPYQTDKSRLLERIAELVREGRIEGITDLRDESDRTGMRICIELTRTVDARQVLADLYKYTPLQSTFGVSLLALVDGEPRLLGLKKILQHFIEYRQQVIVRRSRFELERARQRAHILEGLLRALDVLDEIIALIRGSRTADVARQGLIKQFAFTEVQAQAILDMQLRRLAALERQKLADEYRQIQKQIRDLEALLASPKKVLALIKDNLIDLKARYGDARRTQIADRTKAVLTAREHVVERDVWVALTADGRLAAYGCSDERNGHTGGASTPALLRSPAPRLLVEANTRQDLFIFTESGRAVRVQGHQWPDAPGVPLADLAGIREPVVALLVVGPAAPESETPSSDAPGRGFVLMGTVQGRVKRINLPDLLAQAHTGPQVIGLDATDRLAWAALDEGPDGPGEVLIITASGQAIRFATEEVRAMGLPAGGIGGIRLRDGDRVVAGFALARPAGGATVKSSHLALVTAGGFVKKTPLTDFPAQGRNGAGVVAMSLTAKSGQVAGAAQLARDEFLVCLAAGGADQVLPGDGVPTMARAAQGKALLARGERIERVYSIGGFSPALPGGDGAAPTTRATRAPRAPSSQGNGSSDGGADGQTPRARRKRDGGDGAGETSQGAAPGARRAGAPEPAPGAAVPGPTSRRARRVADSEAVAQTPESISAEDGESSAVIETHGTTGAPKDRNAGAKDGEKSGPRGTGKAAAAGQSSSAAAQGAEAAGDLEIGRTATSVTYDREAVRRAAGLSAAPGQSARRATRAARAPVARQLPLVPDEPPAPPSRSTTSRSSASSSAAASTAARKPAGGKDTGGKPSRPAEPSAGTSGAPSSSRAAAPRKPAASDRASDASGSQPAEPRQPAGRARASADSPATAQAATSRQSAPTRAAGKASNAAADKTVGGRKPGASAGETPPATPGRPRRSAAGGPATRPLLPPEDEDTGAEQPPHPRRPRGA